MSNTNKQTEASAVLVAGAIKNIEALIDIHNKNQIEFDNYFWGNRNLTNGEKDYALKTHFKMRSEISALKGVLNGLLGIQKSFLENA